MFNVRVEFESVPIRHIAAQCPSCSKWFNGWDIVNGKPFDVLRYEHDINWVTFTCPVCKTEFGGLQNSDKANIKEVGSAEECYNDCLQKKEIWE